MFSKYRAAAAMTAVVVLVLTACGSPSGDEGPGGGGFSDAATAAAEELGIDLGACPTDVTAPFGSTVKVGNTMPLTGPVAPALGVVGPVLKAAFDTFNSGSGLDTKFDLVTVDDAFTPDKALTSVQTLLDKDQVDLMTTVIGTAQVAAVRQVLGSECVPLLPGVSGGTSANDPNAFPWTSIFSLPSTVDARIMMTKVEEDHPDGAKVAVLYANNESGKDYAAALEKYKGKNEIVMQETIEGTETGSPSSQITTLRSSGADVLVAAPTAGQCASTMQEVANQGWKPDRYITSVCGSGTFDVAGPAADGWNVSTYVKDPTRGAYANDPDVVKVVDAIEKSSPETPITNTSVGGFMYPDPLFAAAEAAANSPLGLSRLGLLDAFVHLNYQPALLKPGVEFQLDGSKDRVGIEAAFTSTYVSSTKAFEDGKLYDFGGQMTE